MQSISSWAPACIGPYSQATSHQDVLYMAGQLGLDPASMILVQPATALAIHGERFIMVEKKRPISACLDMSLNLLMGDAPCC